MRFYPINLDLAGRSVLVVGGGAIAEGKARQLVEAGAQIHIVSPTLTESLNDLVEQGKIAWRQGVFVETDLDGAWLVISATEDQAVNQSVAAAAAELALLCNVVDQPALCNFITPALIARGNIQISVSTGGDSPSVAQRVRREIGELIGDEYAKLLEVAAEMRAEAKRLLPTYEQRKQALHDFVESDAIELLRAGKRDEARQLAFGLLAAAVKAIHEGEKQ
ncbi:MAG: bifunctional precorrin-2 dehydrogenase/sirohydrochlorin ferrochelatase [Blastocatellia bacterium]